VKPSTTDVSNLQEAFSNLVQFIDGKNDSKEGAKTYLAKIGFISWIPTQSIVNQAIGLCKKSDLPVATLFLKSFNPFPKNDIELFATNVKKIIVIEEDENALLSRMIQRCTGIHPVKVFPPHGSSLTPESILEKVKG
jgi:pyruvate/2-oxoacid:ferredoxin oxidoreductase alpha subunit